MLDYKTGLRFEEAIVTLADLHIKGLKQSCIYKDIYNPYEFTPSATVYIIFDYDTNKETLMPYTKIVKRISSYRGNVESDITLMDILETNYRIVCDIKLYTYNQEGSFLMNPDVLNIDDSLRELFTDGIYCDVNYKNFLTGNYMATIFEGNIDNRTMNAALVVGSPEESVRYISISKMHN